jgi:DNA topoisomerase VI, subunit A
MKKIYLLAATLAGALTTAPGMAEDLRADFRALSKMPTETTVSAMTAEELSQVEGGVNETNRNQLTPAEKKLLVQMLLSFAKGLLAKNAGLVGLIAQK